MPSVCSKAVECVTWTIHSWLPFMTLFWHLIAQALHEELPLLVHVFRCNGWDWWNEHISAESSLEDGGSPSFSYLSAATVSTNFLPICAAVNRLQLHTLRNLM